MSSTVPIFTFNNGVKVPAVGLGCWMGEPGRLDVTKDVVKMALKHGYRHFDTAAGYGNEQAVGEAIHESEIPRQEIFVVTKMKGSHHDNVKEGFESSFTNLGLEYIDLWLMHSPMTVKNGEILQPGESPTYVEAWKYMEKVYSEGKVRAIGVSNFSVKTLEVLLKEATIVPATNQVEMHPCLPQEDLLEYCKSKGIIITAFSPLGQYNSPLLSHPVISKVATQAGASVGQVLISWGVQRGTIVIPKSEKEHRIAENIKIIQLSPESFAAVSDLHKEPGYHRGLCSFYQMKPGKVFGWTYEQLGYNLKWDDEKKWAYVP